MNKIRNLLLAALLLLLLPLAALSGANTWSGATPFATGLGNRIINALAVSADGLTVFAGNGSGTVLAYTHTPTQLASSTPASTTAGTPFSVTVQVQYPDGSVALGNTATVTLAIETNPGSGILSGTVSVAAVNGIATFNGLSMNKAGTGYTLKATAGTLTAASSNAFNITPAAAASLSITAPPSVTAGSAFNLTITALDAFGNAASGYTGSVNFTKTDAASGTAVPASYTFVSGDSGVHTLIGSATLVTVGSQTLTATDTVTGSIKGTTNVTVSSASASELRLTVPTSATAGSAFSVTVTMRDLFNNVATGYTGIVSFATSDSGSAKVLPASYTFVSGDNGVHTFTNGATLVTTGNQTLTATDTVTGSLTATANIAITLPAPVASAASAVTTAGFTANWAAVSGVTQYFLDVAADSAFTAPVSGYNNLGVGNVTSKAVSGLTAGTAYWYRVRAFNASSTSDNSNATSVTTGSGKVVNNTNDSGADSLRQVMVDAVAGDSITFASGVRGSITLATPLTINKDLNIIGPGASLLAISGGGTTGILEVTGATNLMLKNLTLANGKASSGGAALIDNSAAITTIDGCVFSGNAAITTGNGGAILASGSMTISGSVFSGNSALEGGGAIAIANLGVVALTNVTMTGNTARLAGGAISAAYGSTLNMVNTTLANNSAGVGGGVSVYPGSVVKLKNSLVASNTVMGSGPDLYGTVTGPVTSQGHNLIGSPGGVFGITHGVNNDIVGTSGAPINPLLGALADNGGPTQTLALLAGSPALDVIPNGINGCGSTPTADQRGMVRPQNASCDIGAFERGAPASITATGGSGQSALINTAFTTALTVRVDDALNQPLDGISVTFAGPASGASIATGSANSNGSGIASFAATANGSAGSNYTVTASAGSATGATFSLSNTLPSYTISTSVTGSGTLSCAPNPVVQGSDSICTATASGSYSFSGFGGDACTRSSNTCTLSNVMAAKNVTASFAYNPPAPNYYSISAIASPTEGGSVSCAPNPVMEGSGSTCTATASAGYSLGGFGGDCAGSSCNLSFITTNKLVTASFVPNSYGITTTASPTLGGTVSCSPNPVNHGSAATCTATANAGYRFGSFGGDCTGNTGSASITGGICSLSNVTAAKSVGGTFVLNSYSITATANPALGGTVSCSPNPVSHGSNATCTATANAGYSFGSFGGDCTGTGNTGSTCTLGNVTAARSVTASFTLNEVVINGACASVAATAFRPTGNLCTSGTASAVTSASPWTWGCTGSGTGHTDAACSAPNQIIAGTSEVGYAVVAESNNWAVDANQSLGFIPTVGSPDSPPDVPRSYRFLHGLFDLRLTSGIPGSTATVTITYPEALPDNTVYLKYGRTVSDPTAHWYIFAGAVVSADRHSITLTLTDNADGDDAYTTDGLIVDPGGPALLLPDPTPPPVVNPGPVVSSISSSAITSTTAQVNVTIDVAGSGFWLLLPAVSAPPTVAEVLSAGSRLSLGAGTPAVISLTGLTASTGYTLYFVAQNTAGNTQAALASVAFATARLPISCTLNASPAALPSGGGTALLTASCSPTATAWVWTGGICVGSTKASCSVTPLVTTRYSVTGSDAPGSTATASATVTVASSFAGHRADYRLVKTSSGIQVTEIDSGAVSVVTGTTAIQFADVRVNLRMGDLSRTIVDADLKRIIELYVAFFNRIPEADGLAYWIGRVQTGMTIDEVADSFYQAAIDYQSLTGYSARMSHADFVRIIYKNALGRSAPPAADVAYWAAQLGNGQSSRGRLLETMLHSAHGYAGDPVWGWVPQWLDNKVSVARFFAVQQGLNYNTSSESITQGMAIAAAVKPDSTTAALNLIDVKDAGFDLTILPH